MKAMEFNKEIDKGLSEFIQSTWIRRTKDIAEIIVDFHEGNSEKPIRLIGFSTESSKTDFEIFELGFHYYNDLKFEIQKDETNNL